MLMSVFSYTRNARKTKFAEPKVYNLFSLNLLTFFNKIVDLSFPYQNQLFDP